MACLTEGCNGDYGEIWIDRTFTRQGRQITMTGIPALVCDVCGDDMYHETVVERVQALLVWSELRNTARLT